ncbi:hypothetical protein HPB51_022347 [Rhipicephalus microplus]|uniref:Uncharacterized protein n=1 Tax=Rhipicephalus microplus TaxID=6941 RepID=A0A9J6EUX7_RHIMP|nr:hypothetical protein HPB51_022347 [Rhipicephalus microplus]
MVCTKYYAESNGRVLLDAPKRPTLSANAVPCIFPGCPKYLTRKEKCRKSPRKRQPTTSDQPVARKVVLPVKTADAETEEQTADVRPLKKLRVGCCDSAPCQAHSSGEDAPLQKRNWMVTAPHHALRIQESLAWMTQRNRDLRPTAKGAESMKECRTVEAIACSGTVRQRNPPVFCGTHDHDIDGGSAAE